MTKAIRRIPTEAEALAVITLLSLTAAAQQMPQITKKTIAGTPQVTNERAAEEPPARLPKTAGPFPLAELPGLLFTGLRWACATCAKRSQVCIFAA